jgi:cytochrome P450
MRDSITEFAKSVTVADLRHFCAGHAFSRAQVRIAIEALIRRFPKLALDPARPPEFRGWEFRAPRRLDVLL